MENDANPEFQSEPIHSSQREQVAAYLQETYSWHLTPEKIDRDFRAVLEEPFKEPFKAQPNCSEVEFLASLDRPYFVEVLTSRGVLTQNEIQAIADQLETIRLEVLLAMETHQQQVATTTFRQKVEHYLIQTPKDQLLSDTILPEFQILVQDGNLSFEHLNQRLAPYSREELRQILVQRLTHRQDITYEEMGQILDALEATRDRVLAVARDGGQSQDLELEDSGRSVPNELDPSEPDLPEPELYQPEDGEASAQTPVPNQTGAYTWSTWEQAKWRPSQATPAQTEGTVLSWSTWGEINPKAPQQTAKVQPQPQQPGTALTFSTWEQLRSGSTSESGTIASSGDDLSLDATLNSDVDDTSTQDRDKFDG